MLDLKFDGSICIWKRIGNIVAAAAVASVLAMPVQAYGYIFDQVARGSYTTSLNNFGSGTTRGLDNYFAGIADTVYRNFFVFNVPDVMGTITSGTISFGTISANYAPFGSPVYTLYDFNGSIPELLSGTANPSSTFADLGSGAAYGSLAIPTNTTSFSISLNDAALTALNANQGRQIAFGGRVSDETSSGVFPDSQRNSGVYLNLNTVAAAAVPEPTTWAMFIGGFGLIGGAMRRRQRTSIRFA